LPSRYSFQSSAATEIEIERDLGVSPLAVRVMDYLLARPRNNWIHESALWDNLPEPPDTKPSAARMRRLRALEELSQRGAVVRDKSHKRLKVKE
jgi:hypothetical protein